MQIWLYENTRMRIEGQILGFDEYMNLVLDEAEEVSRMMIFVSAIHDSEHVPPGMSWVGRLLVGGLFPLHTWTVPVSTEYQAELTAFRHITAGDGRVRVITSLDEVVEIGAGNL